MAYLSGLNRLKNPWVMGCVAAALAVTAGIAFYTLSQTSNKPAPPPPAAAPTVQKVTALGRLEPAEEVIKLSAPLALDGDRLAQLLVKEGDRVKPGQVIAILDSRDTLQDALRQAQEQVRIAEAKLAQVKAGAKTGEIDAQRSTVTRFQRERSGELAAQGATIARWQSEVRNAQAEYDRFNQLYKEGAITASSLDSKRLNLETAQAQLSEAQAKQAQSAGSLNAQIDEAESTLNRIAEVRPVDVQAAQAEVNSAVVAQERAATNLEQALVRAPMAGQVIKIHTRAGEKLSDDGIVELAQTAEMVAIAEVYQSDIAKIKLGQAAVITGQAFAGEVRGTVSQIGLQISRQNVYSNQPGENTDRRIVEVKVRINPADVKTVAGLTNLQVQVAIDLNDIR
jgi:HlyD family secretion protein